MIISVLTLKNADVNGVGELRMRIDKSAQKFINELRVSKAMARDCPASIEHMRAHFEQLIAQHGLNDVPIESVQERLIPGGGGKIPIRIYRSRNAKSKIEPVLLYFHGGGFIAGGPQTHDTPCRLLANTGSFTVISAGYRLLPEHCFPSALEDAKSALNWVAAHDKELGIDRARIMVGGDSAGGNLAAVLCHQVRLAVVPRIAAQLLIYPLLDFRAETLSRRQFASGYGIEADELNALLAAYTGPNGDQSDPNISPARASEFDGVPPAYIVIAGFDPLRDEAVDYAKALDKSGVHARIRVWPGQIHGFCSFSKSIPEGRLALEEAGKALRNFLKS